jgi:hypothetical protein
MTTIHSEIFVHSFANKTNFIPLFNLVLQYDDNNIPSFKPEALEFFGHKLDGITAQQLDETRKSVALGKGHTIKKEQLGLLEKFVNTTAQCLAQKVIGKGAFDNLEKQVEIFIPDRVNLSYSGNLLLCVANLTYQSQAMTISPASSPLSAEADVLNSRIGSTPLSDNTEATLKSSISF